jgi:hypothetical protein
MFLPANRKVVLSCVAFFILASALAGLIALRRRPVEADWPDPNKPIKITGRVTLDGQPPPGIAVIAFYAIGGPRGAFGRIRRDGSLELSTFAMGDGALPGEYVVCVTGPWVPEVYGDAKRTPLRVRVPAESGQVMLDLKSKQATAIPSATSFGRLSGHAITTGRPAVGHEVLHPTRFFERSSAYP